MSKWEDSNSFGIKPDDLERVSGMLGTALEADISGLPEIYRDAITNGMGTGQLERLSGGGSILQQVYTEVFVKDSNQFDRENLLEILAEEMSSIFGLEVESRIDTQVGTIFKCKRGNVDVSALISFFPPQTMSLDSFGEKLIIVQIFTETDNRN